MRDILFVTVDSLRADHIGCYGYDRPTTPTLDTLAAAGHRCENAFAHACLTRPSFPSILTSSYPLMYGGFERIANGRTLVTEPLADREYTCAGFHSNLYLSADFGYDRGWETYFDSKTDPSPTDRLKQAAKDQLDRDGRPYQPLASAVDTSERQAGVDVGSAYVLADDITDRALSWAQSRVARDGPRFLWVHYMDVHPPYVPPAEHQRHFRDTPVGEREAIQLRRKMIEDPEDLTASEHETLVDLYDSEVRFTDTEIARLLDGVREAWGGSPLPVVTADHGEAFGEHGLYSHPNNFYDEVMHVPLITSGPEVEPEESTGPLTTNWSVYSTSRRPWWTTAVASFLGTSTATVSGRCLRTRSGPASASSVTTREGESRPLPSAPPTESISVSNGRPRPLRGRSSPQATDETSVLASTRNCTTSRQIPAKPRTSPPPGPTSASRSARRWPTTCATSRSPRPMSAVSNSTRRSKNACATSATVSEPMTQCSCPSRGTLPGR